MPSGVATLARNAFHELRANHQYVTLAVQVELDMEPKIGSDIETIQEMAQFIRRQIWNVTTDQFFEALLRIPEHLAPDVSEFNISWVEYVRRSKDQNKPKHAVEKTDSSPKGNQLLLLLKNITISC